MRKFVGHACVLAVACCGFLFFYGCGGSHGTGQLSFVMSHRVEGRALSLGTDTPYVNEAGNQYGVARLLYFVSGIVLHREGGGEVSLAGVHYVDVADEDTIRFVAEEDVSEGRYSGISFVLGLGPGDNGTGSLQGTAENLMAWPEMMGGGYHYMKLEGRFVTATGAIGNFNFHTGGLNGTDYSVAVDVPESGFELGGDDLQVEIVMNIEKWFRGPHVYNFDEFGSGIMGNADVQHMIMENGRDVFSVGSVGAPGASAPARGEPTVFTVELPPGFPVPMLVPEDNPTTVEGVALGRRLFNDTILDGVEDRACGKCHLQESAFSSGNAVGVLPHINLAFNNSFLWDGKIQGTLEDVMLFEVEEFFKADMEKLSRDAVYPGMFENAFGPGPITATKAAYALSQFERTLVSLDSKYDRFLQGLELLTDAEERGRTLFFTEAGDCFHCHGTIFFTDNLFHNNGLDTEFVRKGRGDVTGNPMDDGTFKTPTLRNLEFTAPYMHDDRYQTLEEVVDFYSEGLQYSATIDPLMKNVARGGVHLTPQQKADLVVFLKTLSDRSFVSNPDLSPPVD